jgi:short subunit dehydrogenase-like uncharacterized protein
MNNKQFLLYGANGYTGTLIARFAAHYGLTPILAGRNETTIHELATALQLPFKVFDLADTKSLHEALAEVPLVIHAAGPFKDTAAQMVEACLQTGTHYLDINGDIDVFELVQQYDLQAKKANVMLLPGAGFDVVPTDCIALQLKNSMPGAISLELAFATEGGGVSHGTAMTIAGKLGEGGRERMNGIMVNKPLGRKKLNMVLGGKKRFFISIPWGDVFTAYSTTGIPGIVVFTEVKPVAYYLLKMQFLFNWLLRTEWMRNKVRNKIKKRGAGPSDAMREAARTFVWGRVTNAQQQSKTASISCADGYTFTAHSCLHIAQKILSGNHPAGYQTPASAYGAGLLFEIEGLVTGDW